MLVLGLLLAACGGDTGVQRTLVPSAIPPTLTPRSTALPYVDDAPTLGQEGREITILFAVQSVTVNSDANRAKQALQDALGDELDLEFKVDFVDENVALAALCSGQPTAAWVSAFSYATAASECGAEPVLAIERGKLPNILIGRGTELIAAASITDISQLANGTFCRSEEHDLLTTWILPSLLLSAENINPITDLDMTLDYPDDLSLLNAIYDGTCTAAALPGDDLEDLLIDLALTLSTDTDTITLSDVEDRIHVLAPAGDVAAPSGSSDFDGYDQNVVPFEVLVFAPGSAIPTDPDNELSEDAITREKIVEVVTEFFANSISGDDYLNDMLDATGIFPVDASDYTTFRALISNSGWNMTFAE